MPRPPADGCYAIRRPSGVGFIVQYSGGRLVELLGPIPLERPPRRTATRYLARSFADARRESERRAEEARLRALAAWSAAQDPVE